MNENLVAQLKRHEGFRAKPYQDTLGVWTFGHGLTYISEEESEIVLRMRLYDIEAKLASRLTPHSRERQNVLLNMAYNLGVTGLLAFHRMWTALAEYDYEWAAREMLDSLWARQVGNRAVELAEIMRTGEM